MRSQRALLSPPIPPARVCAFGAPPARYAPNPEKAHLARFGAFGAIDKIEDERKEYEGRTTHAEHARCTTFDSWGAMMATKAKQLPAKVLTPEETESVEKGKAKLTLSNSFNAAAVIELYGKSVFGELRGATDRVCEELNDSIAKLGNGDMEDCEGMLLAQASALQSIFVNLTRRAIHQEGLSQFDTFLRLGLKAQAQAVRTIEALGELKNPRSVAFVKQANIANGPQQINNGEPPRAGEPGNQQSKLLEVQHGNYLDGGTTPATSGADTALAPVGQIDRAEVRRGQSQGSAEQL